jgi:hypothetical protein
MRKQAKPKNEVVRSFKTELHESVTVALDSDTGRGWAQIEGKKFKIAGRRILARDLILADDEFAGISRIHQDVLGEPLKPGPWQMFCELMKMLNAPLSTS